jgi:ATP-binding cassette subfamily B protein
MSAKPRLTLTQFQRADDVEVEERPLDVRLIRRLFTYTGRYARTRNTLFCLVIIRAIQLPSLAWVLGAVITGPISRGDLHGTLLGAAGFAALTAVTQFTLHFRHLLAMRLGESVVHDLRTALCTHLLTMPMSFFHREKLGRIISRVTSDIEAVRAGVQNVMFVSLVLGGQMIVSALFMLWCDRVLFLVVLVLAPVMWLINRMFRQRFSRVMRANQESFSRLTATLAESVNGIRVTQGFVRQDVNAGIFEDMVATHSEYNVEVARTAAIFLPLLEFTSQVFIALLLLVGGYRVLTPGIDMPLSDLVHFFFLAGIFFEPVRSIGDLYHQALAAMAGAERVFRVLDTPPEWQDDPAAEDLPRLHGRVEFSQVSFSYTPERRVLHDINIVAEPGQTIALVGHTGSGKTTIINLLAKFYLPGEGEIRIDDRELRSVRAESLHRQMGIIQQENFLFTGTVMDNIRLGRPEATDAEVTEAARRLDCLDLLEALPDKLQTVVGERGAGLSLGQRQLVCFVRAMLADPRIFVLDEATSSVDAVTEARIQRSLATLMQGRTCFVIAHRLSTIRNADLILVMEHGRIAERGTHPQLIARNGVYANLYRQFVRATSDEE